jgi:YD repeat-containing protein
LSGMTGSIDYEVDYTASGAAQPYRVGRGTVAIGTTAGTLVDTTTSTIQAAATQATPSQAQTMDRWGNILSSTNAAGQTAHFVYNRYNEAIETIDPSVVVVSVAMAANGQTGTVSTATSTPTSYNYYDLYGRLVGVQDGDGNIDGQTYNAANQIINQKDADQGQKAYVYDAFGDQIQSTTWVNASTPYSARNAYDQAGRLTDTEQELTNGTFTGAATGFSSDLLIRTNPNVIRTQYQYDRAGRRVVTVDGAGDSSSTAYDLHGNVSSTTTAIGATTHYAYNAEDEKTSETDGNGNTQSWTYGASVESTAAYFNHVTSHVDMGGATFTYNYDARSDLLTSMSSTADAYFGGENQVYSYDTANHLIKIDDGTTGTGGVNSLTYYYYDTAGRVERLQTFDGGLMAEDTRTQYDALGRVSNLSGVGFSVSYSYDGAGNRTHILADYSTSVGHTSTQDFWYGYDKMNRVAISQGANVSNTVQATNSQGTILTYDWRGDRTSATTYGTFAAQTVTVNESGQNQVTFTSTTGMGLYTYTYDGAARLINTFVQPSGSSQNPVDPIDSRVYDQASRLTQDTTITLQNGTTVFSTQANNYNADGTLLSTLTTQSGQKQTQVNYTYTDESGVHSYYDGAGNVKGYSFVVYNTSGTVAYTGTDTYAYALGDTYYQTSHIVSNSTGGPQNGQTNNTYNADRQLIQYTDTQDVSKNRYFLNDAQGHVLTVLAGNDGNYDGTPSDPGYNTKYGSGDPAAISGFSNALMAGSGLFQSDANAEYFFYDSNGNSVGNYGQIANQLTANFDMNFTPVSQEYPAQTPPQVVVQSADTLATMAARVYGDASLWYILAQANGLSNNGPNDTLTVGLTITVPNVVVARSNNAQSFKPFDMSLALGDTTPTQPIPPPPQSGGGGCGTLGMILMVVVAVIVTIYTAGVAAEAMGATVGAAGTAGTAATSVWAAGTAALSGGLTSVGTGIAAAAIGGAVGSIASQAVGIATGVQSGFNWSGVALGAIGAGVTAGL